MNIDNLLIEEIRYELEGLRDLEMGSKEHELAVNDVAKLMDRAIELDKLEHQDKEHELKEKQYQLEVEKYNNTHESTAREHELNLSRMTMENKAQTVKVCIDVAGIVLPCVITIWGTLKSFEFEKEGTITTIMGRGFINKLLPKK